MNRKEYVEESIKKWAHIEEGILSKLKRAEESGWIKTFWLSCGYCRYYERCPDCPLQNYIVEYPICSGDFERENSHASITLSLADVGKYDEALKHCQIVLNFMREDLENNKDREFSMIYCTKCSTPVSAELNEISMGEKLTCLECEHEGPLTPPNEGDSGFYSSCLEKEVKIIGKF